MKRRHRRDITWPSARPLLITSLLALAMLVVACGDDDTTAESAATEVAPEPGVPAATEPIEPTEPEPTATPSLPPPTPATSPATPATTETAAAEGTPQDPQPGTHNAGTLTLTAQRCAIEGAEFVASSSSEAMPGIALSGDQVYLANADGQTLRFIADTSAGCVVTLDPTWGVDGVYTPESEQDALNIASGTGRLVMSGSVFDADVVDTATGASYVCDVTGEVEVAPDGSSGIAYFPGSAIRQVSFTDTGCTVEDPAPLAASLAYEDQAILALQHMPDGTLVTGGNLPGNLAQVIAYAQDGSELWRQGEADPDAFGDQRYGWVHAISLCGSAPAICTLDTNFRRLQVLDPTGTWLTSADLNDMLGIESAWWEDMESDDQGRLWMPVGAGRTDGDLADGYLFLVTLTGV